MADDLELTSPVNGGDEQPTEREPDISPEAMSAWDRRLAKHGLTPKEEGGGEPAAAAPPVQPARKPPQQQALPPARGHRERQAERQSREQLQARMDSIEASLKALLPKDPDINPDTQPEEYTSALIKKAVLEALGGEEVVSFLRDSREAAVQRRHLEEQVQQESRFLNEWGDEMSRWESEYQTANPDLFDGYYERLHAFIRASDYSQTQLGVPPALARRETMRGLIALTDKALGMNIHPVAYVDALWRQTPEFHKTNGNGGATVRREQAAGNRETRERRQATAAASTLATTKAPPAPTTAGKMAAAVEDAPAGKGRAGALARAARAAGGSAKANLKSLGRA